MHSGAYVQWPHTWPHTRGRHALRHDGILRNSSCMQMRTMNFNTVPDSPAKADGALGAPPTVGDSAAATTAAAASPADATGDVEMADADAAASSGAAADDAADGGARSAEGGRATGASTAAAAGGGGGGKAAAAAGQESKPGNMPRPCAINAMAIHEGSQRIAVAQIGRADYSITVAAFPEPSL